MRLLFLSCLLLSSSFSFAQEQVIFSKTIAHSNQLEPAEGILYLQNIIKKNHSISSDTLALLYHKIGVKYFQIQDFRRGIQNTIISKDIREELSKKGENCTNTLSSSYGNLGGLYLELYYSENKLKQLDSAKYFYRRVIELGDTPDNVRYVSACKELGYQYGEKSDYEKALRFYEAGIVHIRNNDTLSLADKSELSYVYFEKANLLLDKNDSLQYPASVKDLRFAVSALEEDGEYPMLASSYNILGSLLEKTGQDKKAIDSYRMAIKWYKELIDAKYRGQTNKWKELLARTWNNLGHFYILRKENENALDCFDKSLKIKERLHGIGFHISKGPCYVNVGEVYFSQGKYEDAAHFFHIALQHFLPDFKFDHLSSQPNKTQLELCVQKVNLLYALEQKGRALTALKQFDLALHTYTSADYLIDIMRYDRSEAGSNLFWRRKTRNVYENALDLAYKKQNIERAFYFFEKSKAVLLLDALNASDARRFLPDSLAEKEIELLHLAEVARTAAANDKTKHPDYVKTSTDLEIFMANIAEKYPRYHAVRYSVSVPPLINNNTEYIHFFYGEKHIYAMRFGAGESKLTRTVRNEQTDDLIKEYLQKFSSPNIITNDPESYNQRAVEVYELLLKPLFPNEKLPEELVLLPDDFLNVLPFDALKSQPNSDYLLQQTNIRYAYSINVLKNQKSIDNQKIKTLGMAPFADSNDSLALMYSAEELAMVKKNGQGLFAKGGAATKDFFLENAPNFQFLHLSTHAREKGENGNPEIYFSDEKLDLSKLYSTEFNSNLVILSACETGLGEVKKGEGVLSLNRGFTYAGAKSIISSLWRVNDKSTSDILSDFYANLNEKTTKSSALHLAKKDFLQNAEILFQSPYYWAGLTYSGTDGTVVLERNSAWKFLLLGGIVFLVLASLFLRKKIKNATSNK